MLIETRHLLLRPIGRSTLVSVELIARVVLPLSLLLILLAILESGKSSCIKSISGLIPHVVDFMNNWFFTRDTTSRVMSSTTDCTK